MKISKEKLYVFLFVSIFFAMNNSFSSSLTHSETSEDAEPFGNCIAGKHIRISAQVNLSTLGDKLTDFSVLMPNGILFPLDSEITSNGRIPICDYYPFDQDAPILIQLVGSGKYAGCSETVLFSTNKKNVTHPAMQIEGCVLVAIRLQIEERLKTKHSIDKTTPSFLRARGVCRYAESGSITLPLYRKVKIDPFTILAKRGTYANDPDLLEAVLKETQFMRIEEKPRVCRYVECDTESGEKELSTNTAYIVGEYVKAAHAKYGTPEPSMYLLMLNFLIQNHVIDRTEVELVKEMLGL